MIRINEVIMPARSVRRFEFNRRIIAGANSIFIHNEKSATEQGLRPLYLELVKLPLVTEVRINEYAFSITVLESFALEENTWLPIREHISKTLVNIFNTDEYSHTVRKHNALMVAEAQQILAGASLQALAGLIAGVTIPHDFRTHQDAWRKALVIARDQALEMNFSDPTEEDLANYDANKIYWEHELKAFDNAFAALLVKNLPEA